VDEDRAVLVTSLQVGDRSAEVSPEDLGRAPICAFQCAGEDRLGLLVHGSRNRALRSLPVRAHDLVASPAHRVCPRLAESAKVPLGTVLAEELEHPVMRPMKAVAKPSRDSTILRTTVLVAMSVETPGRPKSHRWRLPPCRRFSRPTDPDHQELDRTQRARGADQPRFQTRRRAAATACMAALLLSGSGTLSRFLYDLFRGPHDALSVVRQQPSIRELFRSIVKAARKCTLLLRLSRKGSRSPGPHSRVLVPRSTEGGCGVAYAVAGACAGRA
jgi:hypothetical protein